MESSLSASLKFLPLLVQCVFGFPLLAMNLIKARRKLFVLKSPTKYECTAHVVTIMLQTSLCCSCPFRMLTTKGPKKSIPCS